MKMKKKNSFDGGSVLFGIMLGLLLAMAIALIMTHGKNFVPESKSGITFVRLNIEHCSQTYDQRCYVHHDEWDIFKKTEKWACIERFPQNVLVIRPGEAGSKCEI